MPTLTMRADASKFSAHHKLAAVTGFAALDHLGRHPPAGADAHVDVPASIPAGKYTFELQKDDKTGHITVTLTPGVVP